MFPGNSRGKNSLNIKMWIHRTHKFRYLTLDNYHVYNFQGGGGGQGVVKLYTTTEDFLCFRLYFSSSKSSSMKYAGQGFFFFFLHFTGRETWAEKKIMLLNGFPKMPKTANPKTVATSLFIFPAKNCWLLTLFPIGEISTSFLSSKILASHFKTEYNFKHAKSGSSQNCKYIKITDRVKADGDSKQPGSFIHLFVPLVMQQTFTGSFIYWVQTFIGCSGLSWLSGI